MNAAIFPGSDPSHLFCCSYSLAPGMPMCECSRLAYWTPTLFNGRFTVEGCKGVFCVATPRTLEDPVGLEKELALPAVQGTLNVLEAAKRLG
ncbi:hypothetical protein AB3S75_013486 [Citrus x aurantiifolia]